MTSDAQSICCNHEVRGFLGVVMLFLSAPPALIPCLTSVSHSRAADAHIHCERLCVFCLFVLLCFFSVVVALKVASSRRYYARNLQNVSVPQRLGGENVNPCNNTITTLGIAMETRKRGERVCFVRQKLDKIEGREQPGKRRMERGR